MKTELRILVVDDDADSRFLARRNLMQTFQRVRVDEVENGPEAIKYIPEVAPFDVIITDYRMPHMDGLTLTRKLREAGQKMPIVLRVALDDLEPAAKAAGVSYVLPWYRWRELGAIVERLLSEAETAALHQ